MDYKYFTTSYAIERHDKIIEISGGLEGIKNIGDLESPLQHIQNDDYYPQIEDKVTHLFFTVNKKIILSMMVIKGRLLRLLHFFLNSMAMILWLGNL